MLLDQNKENYVWRQHTLFTEKHTNAHDTSFDPLTTIVAHQAVALLNAFCICHSLDAYSSGTQAKRSSSSVRRHCIQRNLIPTTLKESEDLPLRDTTRLASYKRLGCKSESKRRHSIRINSYTSALLKRKRMSASVDHAAMLKDNYADRKWRSSSPWH